MTISAATLTLDGRNNPNAQWIFQTTTTIITSTATSFILENGAQAQNVFWSVGESAIYYNLFSYQKCNCIFYHLIKKYGDKHAQSLSTTKNYYEIMNLIMIVNIDLYI